MDKILPFFELDNKKYEIKRTRYLMAEYDKLQNSTELSNDEKQKAIQLESEMKDLQNLAVRVKELETEYYEDFDEEIGAKYNRAKAVYDAKYADLIKKRLDDTTIEKINKTSIDNLEIIAIKGLAEQYFNGNEDKAKELWVSFVEKLGKNNVAEWLGDMATCLFTEDEEENSFLSIMRKKAETKANMKAGIANYRKNK